MLTHYLSISLLRRPFYHHQKNEHKTRMKSQLNCLLVSCPISRRNLGIIHKVEKKNVWRACRNMTEKLVWTGRWNQVTIYCIFFLHPFTNGMIVRLQLNENQINWEKLDFFSLWNMIMHCAGKHSMQKYSFQAVNQHPLIVQKWQFGISLIYSHLCNLCNFNLECDAFYSSIESNSFIYFGGRVYFYVKHRQ